MTTNCPLCHSPQYTVVYASLPGCPDASIVKCDHCGHVYTFLPKDTISNDLYSDEVYKVVENRRSIYDRIIGREYRKVLKVADRLKERKGDLLDFGSGKGKFGMLAVDDGWTVKCVETSPERAAYAREAYGLEVNTDFFAGGSIFGIRFDALTLFHVLEHLPSPGDLLKELINGNVKKGGLVIIEVPNWSSWQCVIAGDRWIHLDVPRHVHHFTPTRLERFLRETGLRTAKKSYFSFHLGVLGMVDSLLKRFGYSKNIIYELKNKKSKSLLVKIVLLLPIALVLESIAAWIGKGGVVRMYLFND
jgi:predicted Zn finger-like uncharacterized protein